MPGRRLPPAISAASGFDSPRDLSTDDFALLTCEDKENIPLVLLQGANWNRGAVCTFLISLSPDNNRVSTAELHTFGSLFTEKSVNVATYWPSALATSLSISIPDLSVFNFNGLISNYVNSSEVGFLFSKDGEPLTRDLLQENGVSEFCLRAYIYPTSTTYARLQLLLYPFSEAELALNPLYLDERFPGMQFYSYEVPMSPSPAFSPLRQPWGFPVVPAICPGSPWDENSSGPSGANLRLALSSLLRTARLPEVKMKRSGLLSRIQEIQLNPAKISELRLPGILWPSDILSAPSTEGWLHYLTLLFSFADFFLFS